MDSKAKNYVVGIDIGGQSAKLGIIDRRGNVVSETSVVSNRHTDEQEFVDYLADALKALISKAGVEGEVVGVGVGAPCANYRRGTIDNAANVTWASGKIVPFSEMLSKALGGIPVALTNDANADALGEMYYGAARGMKDFIVITLGTGVGSGIVIDGKLLYGYDGFAGELGHVRVVRYNGRPCGCGRSGCLETYCSATGVVRTAKEMLANNPDTTSSLKNIPLDKLTSLDIYNEAMKQDELALQIFKQTGEMIGEACANVATVLSPEAFIFFGGLANAGDLLMNPIKEAYEKHVLSLYQGKAKFLISGLKGASAAVLGASAMAWEI